MTDTPSTNHVQDVTRYYRTSESRLGYTTLLGGTKHFGWYDNPGANGWPLRPAMRRMEDQLAQRLALPPGARVLDAGCGVGDVARRLAGPPHNLAITGIDILAFNLQVARRRSAQHPTAGPGSTEFQEMDYSNLTFPDASFDGAYTMETLVHSDQVERVLAGLHRVLRPGGRLVHFEYSRTPAAALDQPARDVLTAVNRAAVMPGFQRLEHGTLERLLTSAGFVDVVAEDLTAHMLPMLKAFSRLAQIPYAIARLAGRPEKLVNSMSAVEFLRHQHAWRYQAYSCRKP